MSLADDLEHLATVVDAIEGVGATVDDIDGIYTSRKTPRVQLTLDLPEVNAQMESETATDDGEEETDNNPYEPTDFGHYSTVDVEEYSTGTGFKVPNVVCDYLDAYRGHFREQDGRFELAPGVGPDDCIDYKLSDTTHAENQAVLDLLDVVEGDRIHFEPDGDVVVVEPERIAEREEDVHDIDVDALEDELGLSDTETGIVAALASEGELPGSELQTVTGQTDTGIYHRLSNLQDIDVITERDDPDDGRRTLYSLSEFVLTEFDTSREKRHAEAVFGGDSDGGVAGAE